MKSPYPNLKNRPWVRNRHVKKLFRIFREAHAEARIVGGAVRNALLSRPVHEIDLAVNIPPDEVLSLASKEGLEAVPTGIKHGTVTIILGEELPRPVEVTTLRKDVHTDGRHANVAFTDKWEVDASRRDFTINALYCSEDGSVYDPLGVYEDLKEEKVVFIGQAEERIKEDYLRILRFFRFSAEYGNGELDTTGLEACTKLQSGLEQLSRERIGNEFLKLIVARNTLPVLKVMAQSGIYTRLLDGVFDLTNLKSVIEFEKQFSLNRSAIRRLAALGLPAFKAGSLEPETLQAKLSLTSRQRDRLSRIWQLALNLPETLDMENIEQYFYLWGEDLNLDLLSFAYALSREKTAPCWEALYQSSVLFKMPVFPIRGDDLIETGFKRGPQLGAELKRLEGEWIRSNFTLGRNDLLSLNE